MQGLQPGTSYRVRVLAHSEAGAGASSQVSSYIAIIIFISGSVKSSRSVNLYPSLQLEVFVKLPILIILSAISQALVKLY